MNIIKLLNYLDTGMAEKKRWVDRLKEPRHKEDRAKMQGELEAFEQVKKYVTSKNFTGVAKAKTKKKEVKNVK